LISAPFFNFIRFSKNGDESIVLAKRNDIAKYIFFVIFWQ
jgi:hypothetical protein